jgi:hypothetical protein
MSFTVSFTTFTIYTLKNLIFEREFKIQSFHTNFAQSLIIDNIIF